MSTCDRRFGTSENSLTDSTARAWEYEYRLRYFGSNYGAHDQDGARGVEHDSPIIISKLQSIDELFYEPIYQAVRHILMAHEIKKHHDEIDEVVVLHLRSERNTALLVNPSRGLSTSSNVYDAIRAIMRRPEMLIDVEHEMLPAKVARSEARSEYPTMYLRDRYAP